jgi:Asp-tRNA(Asn)/Glu-tRNA(Gln) amidotransferase A subunit family amidase
MATEMAHNLAPWSHAASRAKRCASSSRTAGGSPVDYLGALAKAQRYAAGLTDIFDAYDATVTPAAPGVAPKGLGSTGDPTFCTLWTLTGLPALSLPLFAGADGLPIGAQLVGTLGRDGRLLRTASALIDMLRETKKGSRSSGAKTRR